MIERHGLAGIDDAGLCALIERERTLRDSLRPSGWVGPKTLFNVPLLGPLVKAVALRLPPGLDLKGRAVCLEAGECLDWHDHVFGRNVLAGVYYPSAGAGVLEFAQGDRFEPAQGALIVVDSSLWHRVIATGPRLSIAFNAATTSR